MGTSNLKEALECVISVLPIHVMSGASALTPASAKSIGIIVSRHIQPAAMDAVCAASVRAVCQQPKERCCTGTGMGIWCTVG